MLPVAYDYSHLGAPARLTLEMLAAAGTVGMLAGAEACVLRRRSVPAAAVV